MIHQSLFPQSQTLLKSSFTPAHPGLLQRKCACGKSASLTGTCSECQRQQFSLQRRPKQQTDRDQIPPIVYEVLRSPGQTLDENTRTLMETQFGKDFRHVQVHTNTKAAKSAGTVNALAYTVGKDVVFGAGQYAPNTVAGRKLIAHELSHVLQQSHSGTAVGTAQMKIGDTGDRFEREANWVESQFGQTQLSSTFQHRSTALQRQPDVQKQTKRRNSCPKGFDKIERATWFHCGESGARNLACAICSPENRRDCSCTNITNELGHTNIIAPPRIGKCGDIFEITVPGRTDPPLEVVLAERPGGTPLDIHRDVIPQLGLSEEQGRYTVCLKRTNRREDRIVRCGSARCTPATKPPETEIES
jgi:hypothetical protein